MDGEPVLASKVGEEDRARRLNFGRLLSSALKARDMKQDELAGMLGTTQSSVSGWINGKYEPGAATVFCVERCLGVDPGSLSRALGYLPVESTASTENVETAIAQSTRLDDEEKAALAAIYRVLAKRSLRRGRGSSISTATARRRSVAGGR